MLHIWLVEIVGNIQLLIYFSSEDVCPFTTVFHRLSLLMSMNLGLNSTGGFLAGYAVLHVWNYNTGL